MKPLLTLYRELESIDLNKEGAVPQFESILEEIGGHNDTTTVVELIRFLDDKSEYDEVMFSIIHLIEMFDDEHYVAKLLEACPELCEQKPRWASIIFMRILNSESTKRELIQQLRLSPQNVKNGVRLIMEKINSRSVKFLEKSIAVLLAAG